MYRDIFSTSEKLDEESRWLSSSKTRELVALNLKKPKINKFQTTWNTKIFQSKSNSLVFFLNVPLLVSDIISHYYHHFYRLAMSRF